MVLKPGQELNVVTLKLKSGISYSDVKVNSHVLVKTNVSDVLIRLLSFNGKLELVSESVLFLLIFVFYLLCLN